MNHEWAGVHIANWVNEAHHTTSSTQVQTRKRFTECIQVEERIASKHIVAVCNEPVINLALLCLGWVQFIPCVCTSTRRTQASDSQLRAVAVGKLLECI